MAPFAIDVIPDPWVFELFAVHLDLQDLAHLRKTSKSLHQKCRDVFTGDWVDFMIKKRSLEYCIKRAFRKGRGSILRRVLQHAESTSNQTTTQEILDELLSQASLTSHVWNLDTDVLNAVFSFGCQPTFWLLHVSMEHDDPACTQLIAAALKTSDSTLRSMVLQYDAVKCAELVKKKFKMPKVVKANACRIATWLLDVRKQPFEQDALINVMSDWPYLHTGEMLEVLATRAKYPQHRGVIKHLVRCMWLSSNDSNLLQAACKYLRLASLDVIVSKLPDDVLSFAAPHLASNPIFIQQRREDKLLLRIQSDLAQLSASSATALLDLDSTYSTDDMALLLIQCTQQSRTEEVMDVLASRGARLPPDFWSKYTSLHPVQKLTELGADPKYFGHLEELLKRQKYDQLEFMIDRGAPVDDLQFLYALLRKDSHAEVSDVWRALEKRRLSGDMLQAGLDMAADGGYGAIRRLVGMGAKITTDTLRRACQHCWNLDLIDWLLDNHKEQMPGWQDTLNECMKTQTTAGVCKVLVALGAVPSLDVLENACERRYIHVINWMVKHLKFDVTSNQYAPFRALMRCGRPAIACFKALAAGVDIDRHGGMQGFVAHLKGVLLQDVSERWWAEVSIL